jgi:acyl transferase domain-containing protein/acyl-CoA synthetase (AMP-forming)/AMP-acid ligase II/thioesterase domain-containing protein/aryl carrier-like protein
VNVALWADQHVARYGDYDALLLGGQRFSNQQLHERACRLATGLVERGLKPGDRVVIDFPPSAELVIAFTGVLRAGGVVVVVSHTSPDSELQRVIEETSAQLLLTATDELEAFEPMAAPVPREDDDPAQIVLTSGATGESKGVVWCHSTIQARYLEFADNRRPTAQPRRSLCALPFASAFGTQYLYLRLLQKMQLVLVENFEPSTLISAIERHRVQATMLVPSICEALLKHPAGDLTSLKNLLVGGSYVSASLIQRFHERFGVRITPVYGLTELGPVSRAGHVRPGLDVRIGQDGEVQVRAGSMQAGYLAAESPEKSPEEWFRTGDLGYFDEQGRLQLTGRSKDLIIQGGVSIAPSEVEEAIGRLEDVQDCAVVGIPEPFLGEEMVAFVVSDQLSAEHVHRHLRQVLDIPRQPTRVLFCRQIPRNELGKIKRYELLKMESLANEPKLETDLFRQLQQLSPQRRKERLIGLLNDHVGEAGLDSLGRVALTHTLSNLLGRKLPLTLAFNYPPVEPLAERLLELFFAPKSDAPSLRLPLQTETPIAIVGVGCRLPGTDSPETFWDLLCQGADLTQDIERWNMDDFTGPDGSVTRRAGLTDIELFDADFFGFTTREARSMDPQHRMVLESAWHALEHAGYDPSALSGSRCGVFLGISGTTYSSSDPLGVSPSLAAGRISHLLNLKGPAMAVDTSCSSSLVALHTAVQGLRQGQFDVALAGGVNAICSVDSFIALSRIRALSPDGRCKAFDARADGFGRGEGCVMFALKRQDEALRNGDPILAVIRGAAINHDGRSSSLTAPSGPAQQAVLRAALVDAGMEPSQVDYLEAHGTGTAVGDPIELEAAVAVLGDRVVPLLVGSVKTNLGHLEAAAGAVGLLKAAGVVREKLVPPHLHFRTINPILEMLMDRVRIPTEPVVLPGGNPRAAVMSMGMSGTNACLIVESAPCEPEHEGVSSEGPYILCLSAKSPDALLSYRDSFGEHLKDPVGDFCYTSAVGRSHFNFRDAVVGRTVPELIRGLRTLGDPLSRKKGKLALLFTGQGAHDAGSGQELYRRQPAFRNAFDDCCQILDVAPQDFLFETARPQSSTFAIEWSLYKLWTSWGIIPDLVCGHSLGEYVAACVAGVFSLEDGLRLVIQREQLMNTLPSGGVMISVLAEVDRVCEVVGDLMEVGAVNGPSGTVLSGHEDRSEEVGRRLSEAGIPCKTLKVSGAFHSKWMDPILQRFQHVVVSTEFKEPQIPMVSSVTGQSVSQELCQSEYWVQGLRQTVQFSRAMESLCQEEAGVFLEIGPHAALLPMVQGCLRESYADWEGYCWAASMIRGTSEQGQMLEALAELYRAGLDPDWQAVYAGQNHRRVPIPTYPFQRRRYWGAQTLKSRPAQNRVRELPKVQNRSLPNLRACINEAACASLGLGTTLLACSVDLLQAGLDSLRMMTFIHDLWKALGVSLTPADVVAHPTVDGLVAFLQQKQLEKRGPQLVALRSPGDGVPLVCIHPAGGQITAYLWMETALPDHRPLYAIQTDQIPESIEAAAKEYAELVQHDLPTGPLGLFGWSLGGLIAHQMAHVLESEGRSIEAVQMVDVPETGQPVVSDLAALAGVVLDHNPDPPRDTFQRIRLLLADSPSERALLETCEAQGLLAPGRLDSAYFHSQLALYKGHMDLLSEHTIHSIQADLFASWASSPSRPDKWERSTSGRWEQDILGGDHYSVLRRVVIR